MTKRKLGNETGNAPTAALVPASSPRCAAPVALLAHRACVGLSGLARQQCSYSAAELNSERQPAPTATHHKKPLAGRPPVGQTLVPFAAPASARPRKPKRQPPQRAAPCTTHRSHKTSRDTPHLRRPAPLHCCRESNALHAGLRGMRRAHPLIS